MMADSVFSKLPPEMLCAIFEKLSFETILQCRQVCHKWQTLVDSYFIKTNIIFLNNSSYPYVKKKKSNLEARTLTVRDFWTDCSTKSKSVSRCSLARNAKHVTFGSANAIYQSDVRTQENMVLILMGVFVSLSDTLNPVSFCSKLDTLEIDHFFVSSIPIIPSVRILTITGYVLVENIFPQIIASNLTNLEQFSYADMSSHPSVTEEDMNNFKRLIGLPKIKRLKICMLREFEAFLDDLEGVSWDIMDTEVTFRDNFLPFYDITVNRINQVRQHGTS